MQRNVMVKVLAWGWVIGIPAAYLSGYADAIRMIFGALIR